MSFASYLLDTAKLQPQNPKIQGMIGDVVSSAVRENFKNPQRNFPREDVRSGRWGIPSQDTYASRWSSGVDAYYYYFDEAIRNSTANALAMRRDPTIMEPLRHRQMAIVSQSWYLKPDDPDDMDQQKVCDELTSVVESTTMLKGFLINLLDDIYFGKAGVQCRFGYEPVKGKQRLCVIDHAPVMGDKIQYKYDGTPGILIYSASPLFSEPEYKQHIGRATIGLALFLNEPWLRDRFIISKFMTSDFDYIWEGDKALAVHGIGMRDSIYWAWNLRTEILTWITDAIQRIGANGMTIGFFEYGNAHSEAAVTNLIKTLVKDSYAVCGVESNVKDPQNMIHNIPVTPAGYEIMIQLVQYLDDFIRRAFLGQELTSTARASGMGSGTADIQKSSFDHIVGFDSDRISEAMSKQLIKVLLKYNEWDYKGQRIPGDKLPFAIRFVFEDQDDEDDKPAETARTLHEIGVPLDIEDIRDKTGFEAPVDKDSLLPGQQSAQPQAPPQAPPQDAAQGNGQPPNGQPQQMAYGDRSSSPVPIKNGHPIDQMEMFNGPPDEKRDNSGKWTVGGGGGAKVKEKPKDDIYDPSFDNGSNDLPDDDEWTPTISRDSEAQGAIKKEDQVESKQDSRGRRIYKKDPHIVDGNLRSMFGQKFSDEFLANVSGAPDGSDVSIKTYPGSSDDSSVHIFWDSQDGKARAHRVIKKNDNGDFVMSNESFFVDEDQQGKGIGAKAFGLQVKHAYDMGVDKIETFAARSDGEDPMVGYKVWPLFGYDAKIPKIVNGGSGPRGERRISDLFKTQDGRDWWEDKGRSIDLTFDLTPNSYSMRTWNAYQEMSKKKREEKS